MISATGAVITPVIITEHPRLVECGSLHVVVISTLYFTFFCHLSNFGGKKISKMKYQLMAIFCYDKIIIPLRC